MSTNKTTNYQLHAWEANDDFLRQEFNENFTAIDTALGSKAEIVAGVYTGDGNSHQIISLGFTPKAVLLMTQNGIMTTSSNYLGGLSIPDHPAAHSRDTFFITEGGFDVSYIGASRSNQSGTVYHYLAVR